MSRHVARCRRAHAERVRRMLALADELQRLADGACPPGDETTRTWDRAWWACSRVRTRLRRHARDLGLGSDGRGPSVSIDALPRQAADNGPSAAASARREDGRG